MTLLHHLAAAESGKDLFNHINELDEADRRGTQCRRVKNGRSQAHSTRRRWLC